MINKHRETWSGKVRVVGLGIDEKKVEQLKFVQSLNGDGFEHYNIKNDTSKAIKYFGLEKVPTSALIDKQGKIVMIGDLNKRMLDEDISMLLADRKLEGSDTTDVLQNEA